MSDSTLPQETSLAVSHVADCGRRYPGEPVTFYTRVDVRKPAAGFDLRIGLPEGLAVDHYRASPNHGDALPDLLVTNEQRFLAWSVEKDVQAGERYEYELRATIAPAQKDQMLSSRALVMARAANEASGSPDWAAETANVAVSAKGSYLKYLPAIYADLDEFMGRFVILFESFWAPIQDQVANIHYYLDPKLMPAGLLPWMSGWSGLQLNEQWPEERRRQLVRSAVQLFRRRGTARGLRQFLEIFTGVTPRIVEHRAYNLRLGPGARLGAAVALGEKNVPHTFTVVLRLPPAYEPADSESERARKETERRRKIEAIIEAEKPAHTTYDLQIELVSGWPEVASQERR
jgi:phage tail-like protein